MDDQARHSLLGIADGYAPVRAGYLAGVPDLSAAFGVERRAEQGDLDFVARVRALDGFIAANHAHDYRIRPQRVVSEKRRPAHAHAFIDSDFGAVFAESGAGARPLSLDGH